MKSKTLRRWIWWHKWSSLVSTLFLLMLCITGLPLIFHEEIEQWLNPHPPMRAVASETVAPSLESMAQRALASRPAGYVVPFIFFVEDRPDVVAIATAATLRQPAIGDWVGLQFDAFDRRDGHLLLQETIGTGFMNLMLRLHTDLFVGLPGTLFLGFMGALLTVAVVSGVVVYAPFMRKMDFATVRADRGMRIRWLDMHNLLGIVTVAWMLVVGITGVINTLAKPLESLWQSTELDAILLPYKDAAPLPQRAPVDVAIATVRRVAPDMKLRWINFPGAVSTSPHHYTAFLAGNTPLTGRLRSLALIDAGSGQLTAMPEMPWYMKTLYLSQPLHFGDYGGLPLKTVWALLTLITVVVLGSGVYLWLRKPTGAPARVREPGRAVT